MSKPITHVVLIVPIGDKKYVLEPSMAMMTPRYPILIVDDKELVITQNRDEFRLYKQNEVFVLEYKLKGSWFTLMQMDMLEATSQQLRLNLLRLERSFHTLTIRDEKVLVSILTDKGGKSLMWDCTSKVLKYMEQHEAHFTTRLLTEQGKTKWEEAISVLVNEFHINDVSMQTLKEYCSDVVAWPRPLRRWEIDLPITEKDRQTMKTNF